MVSTGKVIGFYTDIFGDEIYEYEQIEQYTVCYKGHLFEGDTDGYNFHNYDRWEDAIALYYAYPDLHISIKDNKYDVTFEDGEWN